MELASMLTGEPFSDHPSSVCPVIAARLRACNDRLADEERQRLVPIAASHGATASEPATSPSGRRLVAH